MGVQRLLQNPCKVAGTEQHHSKLSSKNGNETDWPNKQQLCKLMESRGTEALLKVDALKRI